MTPTQLKAMLPTENKKIIISEKLYTLKELGEHFGRHPTNVQRYIRRNKIKSVTSEKAKWGFHNYYRLKDLKNYAVLPSNKRLTIKINSHKKLNFWERLKFLFSF